MGIAATILKLLADDGIIDSDGITNAAVLAAILRATRVRAFPAIRAFLRFLAEKQYLEHDYSSWFRMSDHLNQSPRSIP